MGTAAARRRSALFKQGVYMGKERLVVCKCGHPRRAHKRNEKCLVRIEVNAFEASFSMPCGCPRFISNNERIKSHGD